MAKILSLSSAHTGDTCYHCGQREYYWRMQIESIIPKGIVNICLCGGCVLLPPDELLEPLLKYERMVQNERINIQRYKGRISFNWR